jgi:pilus assembly protein CpaE
MLRSLIISSNAELAAQLSAAISRVGTVSVKVLDHYPNSAELSRMVRAHAPQVVFLSAESLEYLVAAAGHLDQILPGIQLVAVGQTSEPNTLMTLMRTGIREFLTSPFDAGPVNDCLARINDNLKRRPVAAESTDLVYSFLPAKPGSGASTLAVNASLALAQQNPNSTLLSDFDLNSGVVRFLLKLNNSYTVLDAAQKAKDLDENLWSQLVSKSHSLDVLQAGVLNPEIRLDSLYLRDMIDYARRNYKVVCFDLSGNLEKYSLELMHESRRVFLVCTAEPCSLYLAREKVQYLKRMGLGERVNILLNRHQKRGSLAPKDVEDLVEAPVLMTFSNDYGRIAKAITQGGPIETSSELGKQCAALASFMSDKKAAASDSSKRRFLEYFSIAPTRFTAESR